MAKADNEFLRPPFNRPQAWYQLHEDDKGNPISKSLFIGNIPLGTKGDKILRIFAAYGEIESSLPPAFGQVDRGYAFLNYRDIDGARRALFACHMRDLFNHGQGCKIRFTTSQQHSKPQIPREQTTRISEARSEWFQQSTTTLPITETARRDNGEAMVSESEPQKTKLPPSAPKKMLEDAKKNASSPSAPKSMRVDVSPPLRRSDCYRPGPTSPRDEYRRSSYSDLWPRHIDSYKSSAGGDLGRFTPNHGNTEQVFSPVEHAERQSYLHPRARSPLRSPTSRNHHTSRTRSASLTDWAVPSQQQVDYTGPLSDSRSNIASSAGDYFTPGLSGNNLKLGARQSVAAGVKTGLSQGNCATEGTPSNSLHLNGFGLPPKQLQTSLLAFPKQLGAAFTPVNEVDSFLSGTSHTKSQDDQVAQRVPSTALNRLRVPSDDNSSVTSSSTKSSTRKKLCAQCKAVDGLLLGALTRCNDCNRRYHSDCGSPSPAATKGDESFTCGRCLRKSRAMSSMSEQNRQASPELGTPTNDTLLVTESGADEPTEDPGKLSLAPRLSPTEIHTLTAKTPLPEMIKSVGAYEWLPIESPEPLTNNLPIARIANYSGATQPTVMDEIEIETSRRASTEPVTSCESKKGSVDTTGALPPPPQNVLPESPPLLSDSLAINDVTAGAKKAYGAGVGDVPPIFPVKSAPKDASARTNFDGAIGRFLQHTLVENTKLETNQTVSTKPRLEESATVAMAFTITQEEAVKMAIRYKTVTCPEWKNSSCRKRPDSCMFAHEDTGIDAADRYLYSPLWTCYDWMHGYPCPHGTECKFSHHDTGLYIGVDGRSSKKHVTCTYWRKGFCMHAERLCLFAHRDTGILAHSNFGRIAAPTKLARREHRDLRPRDTDLLTDQPDQGSTSSPTTSMLPQSQPRIFTPTTRNQHASGKHNGTAESRHFTGVPPTGVVQTRKLPQPLQLHDHTPSISGTVESTSYSPTSTIEGHINHIQGINTPFSPASGSTRDDQELVRGVDTPYSLMSAADSAKQFGYEEGIDKMSSTWDPTLSSPYREASTKSTTGNSPASTLKLMEPGASVSIISAALSPAQRNTGAQEIQDTKTPSDEMPKTNTLVTNANTHPFTRVLSKDSPTKTGESPLIPAKHLAKRSTVDQRVLWLNLLASVAAKKASPIEGSGSNVTNVKKCEKCDKRIFGSTSLCTSCGRHSVSTHDLHDRNIADSNDSGERSPLIGISKETQISQSELRKSNEARSILSEPKRYAASSISNAEPVKSLKRPNEDSLFIQRKKPKVIIPSQKSSIVNCQISGSETLSAQRGLTDWKQQLDNSKQIGDAILIGNDQTDIQGRSEILQQELGEISPSMETDSYKEDLPPTVRLVSVATEKQDQSQSAANHDFEDPKSTDQNQGESSSRIEDTTETGSRPQEPTMVVEEDEQNSVWERASQKLSCVSEKRILLKLTMQRCERCTKYHRKCLHNSSGGLDPARSAEYLEQRKDLPKGAHFNTSDLVAVKAAARLHTGAKDGQKSDYADDIDYRDVESCNGDDTFEPASPSSSEDPLDSNSLLTSRRQLRARPSKLYGSKSEVSQAGRAGNVRHGTQPLIPTPAQTPSPALNGPEDPVHQKSPTKAAGQAAPSLPNPKMKQTLAMLRKRGVQFDSDSDGDSAEETEDEKAPAVLLSCWPPKESSLHLFEVAPALRPPSEPTAAAQKPKSNIPNLHAGLPKKKIWENLLKIQCAERRLKFGNPHQSVERDLPSRLVKTTVQVEVPLTEAQRLDFHVASLETKKRVMPFERFLRMPEEPVVVREKQSRNREGGLEFDLAYRDGKKDREKAVTSTGRRIRDNGEQWPFARG